MRQVPRPLERAKKSLKQRDILRNRAISHNSFRRLIRSSLIISMMLTFSLMVFTGSRLLLSGSAELANDCPVIDFLGSYPDNDLLAWSGEAQGVAHDDEHWFFTTRDHIWKYDVDADFDPPDEILGVDLNPPVLRAQIGIPAPMRSLGYDHFGDPDQYSGYIFVPVEDSDSPRKAAIAAFLAADITVVEPDNPDPPSFVGFFPLGAENQNSAAWLTVNVSEGLLYTSDDNVGKGTIFSFPTPVDIDAKILRYGLDIDTLRSTGDVGAALAFKDAIELVEADGGPLDPPLQVMQGGVFSPLGDLYLVNGKSTGDVADVRGGIHVFRDGRLIAESVDVSGLGGFKYEYTPGGITRAEPEGIDWWDRDPGQPLFQSTPGINGQLHAVVLNNELLGQDIVEIKHYRVDYSCLTVEKFFTDTSFNLLPEDPFGNPKVDVVLANGVVRSTNPGQIMVWVNVTNTGTGSFQSLSVNETLPVDWTVHPDWLPAKGAIHVFFEFSDNSRVEITDPSTITVGTGPPETVSLTIPDISATAAGKTLDAGESVLMYVKMDYALQGTMQSPSNYPVNNTDTVSVAGFTMANYQGTVSTASATGFFVCYAKVVGDVDMDMDVDILDASRLAYAFKTKRGDARWNAEADFDYNGVIDIYDASQLAAYFETS